MKAAYLTGLRQPLEFRDAPVPEPGPSEVRIRMQASGVCGTDVHFWHGQLTASLPIVLGHEPVGIIDALGPGVVSLQVGDRVGVSWCQAGCGRCRSCQRHRFSSCKNSVSWMNYGGGHQEFMIARAEGCTLLPDGLAWEPAAPMFCAGFTVMSGYRNGRPQTGERIAVIGLGGLGHLAIQIAKAYGHETVVITGTENKRKEAMDLGADEVLVVKNHAGKELADMGGVDVILSTSNSMPQNSQVLDGLRPRGRFVSMAIGEGKLEIDPLAALDREIEVIGSQQGAREYMVEILELAAAGKVKPMLEVYPMDQANEVMNRLESGKVRYRSVLTIPG